MRSFKNLFLLMLMALVLVVVVGCGGTKIELSFANESYEVEVGKELPLTPTVKNEKDEEYTLVYSSEAPTVATYVNGKVDGIAVGETVVKVTLEGNDKVFAETTIKVVAAAVVQKFKVTFNVDGGSPVAVVEVNDGAKLAKPANPTKDGFVFAGWYTNAAKTTEYNFDTAVKAALTLYAKWNEVLPDAFVVTFNTDGGTAIDPAQVEDGEQVTKPADPTKEGFTFDGWFTDEDRTTAFNFDTDVITEDVTLYAKWNVKKFVVAFNTNGAENIVIQQIESGEFATKPADPTKEGYLFAGWFTNTALTNEFNFETDAITANIVLNAKWDLDMTGMATVELVVNDGGYSILDQDFFIPGTTDKAYKLGVFDHLDSYLAQADKNIMFFYVAGKNLSGTGWAHKVGLKINADGFYEVTEQVAANGTNSADLTRFDAVIVSHDTNKTGGHAWVQTLAVGEIVTITGLANETPGVVDAMLNAYPAGSGSFTESAIVREGTELPKPVKENFVFGGWYNNPEFSGEPVTQAVDGKLYAKWTIPTYDFAYELNKGEWSWTSTEVTNGGNGIDEFSTLPEIFMQDFFIYLRDNNLLESTKVHENLRVTTWADFSKLEGDPLAVYNKTSSTSASTPDGYSQFFYDTATGDTATGEITSITGGFFGSEAYGPKYATLVQHIASLMFEAQGDYSSGFWAGESAKALAGFILDGYFYNTQGERTGNFQLLRSSIPTPEKGFEVVEGALVEYTNDFLKTKTSATETVELAVPSRDGYFFVGWYANADFTGDVVKTLAAGAKPAAKYFAKWEASVEEHDVTFESNGGSAVETIIVLDKRTVVEPVAPTKTGFEFVGWFTDADLTTEFVFTTPVTEDIKLFAKWSLIERDYTITFDSNEGDSVDPVIVHAANAVAKPADPTKEHYTFAGWFLDKELTKTYDFESSVYEDLTLYAKWNAVEYTITYNLNEGEFVHPVLADKAALKVALLTDFYAFVNPEETLEVFMHGVDKTEGYAGTWHATHIGKLYNGARPTEVNDTYFASSALYMDKWLPFFDYMQTLVKQTNATQNFWGDMFVGPIRINEYFIEKRYQTTLAIPGEYKHAKTYTILSADVALPKVAKDGEAFLGWFDNAELTGTGVTSIASGSTGNKVLFAKWGEAATYTVTFDTDEGIAIDPVTLNAGESVAMPATPTKEGFKFLGWFADEELTVEYNFSQVVSADLTLYAKWKSVLSTITYDFNDGKLSDLYLSEARIEMLEAFLTDFYNFLELEDITLATFMHGEGKTTGFDGLYNTAVHFDKLYAANNKAEDASTGLFINQPEYNSKWLPFFDLLERYTKSNPDQSFWAAPSTGIHRIKPFFLQKNLWGTWIDLDAFNKVIVEVPELYLSYSKLVTEEETISLPVIVKEGFEFVGWYLDAELTLEFDVESKITDDVTLYAKWEAETPVVIDYANVSTYAELVAALANEEVLTINLLADITADEKLLLARDGVTINGNNHSLTLVSAEGWQGDYILHVYQSQNVVIKDIKFDGGDAALLVNGATVKLEGTITLANHEFGGIEVSTGVDVTTDLKLELAAGLVLTFAEEAYGTPAIWEDKVTEKLVGASALFSSSTVKANQVQYYVVETNSVEPEVVSTIAEARDAAEGDLVITKGIVTALVGNNAFIQDATSGLYLYVNKADFADDLVVGNEVKVYGTKKLFNGLVQLDAITKVEVLQTEQTLPEAVVLTELVLDDVTTLQGKLVSIEGLTIKDIPTLGTGHISVILTNGTVDIVLYTYSYSAAHAAVKTLLEGAVEGQGIKLVAIPVGAYNATQFIVTDVDQLVLQPLTAAQIEAALTTELDPGTDLVADVVLDATAVLGGKTYTITWTSDKEAVISAAGVVVRPAAGETDALVALTAEVKDGETVVATLVYDVTVKAEPDSGEAEPVTVTAAYPSGAGTGNMTADNNASTIGLDESLFTVTSIARAGLHVGLNNSGQIRLYGSADTNGNVLTFSIASGYKITSVEFSFGGTVAPALIKVGEVEKHNGSLTTNSTLTFAGLDDTVFSIKNINTGTGQLYVLSVAITYIEV